MWLHFIIFFFLFLLQSFIFIINLYQISILTTFSILQSNPNTSIFIQKHPFFIISPVTMCSLQAPNYIVLNKFQESNKTTFSSSVTLAKNAILSNFWGSSVIAKNVPSLLRPCSKLNSGVYSMSTSAFKMNLNEYMVILERPFGIRFALSADGKIFVHSIKKGGNAEKSRIIMVGDTLKKASEASGGKLIEIKDFGGTESLMKEKSGTCSMILERPFMPFPIHQLYLVNALDVQFNRGRVPIVTWNKNILASNLATCSEGSGNSGFASFSPKYLAPSGWKYLSNQSDDSQPQTLKNAPSLPFSQLVSIFSEEVSGDEEWAHGSFPLEEYVKALDRSKGELYYNHSLGMRYSKVTEQIYVGSCVQEESDVETLTNVVGVSAVVNLQSGIEAANWGIKSNEINEACQRYNILMINYPIREGDSFDLRKKLPFCVGLLLRLLRKNYRVYVTCTTGFDRSPTCVTAYLHWMTDTSLHAAYNFVTGLHSCRPDRPAIAWATWDLIAMVVSGRHDGPATHAVTFVYNGHEGEDVSLVGDFTGNWKEPIKVVHKGGPRFEVDVRLHQGKYYYKYIIGGQWRHSTSSPTERDKSGNLNNVIEIGDVASMRPSAPQPKKDANIIKVIERPLTENERFMLAKAARCVAFSVCPIKLSPK